MIKEEKWKDIPGFEGKYLVSELGRVMSFAQGSNSRRMKQAKTHLGYMTINLTDMNLERRYKKFFVHRLVWVAFNGSIPEGLEVDHIDRVRHNNRLENLRLLTPIDNRSKPGVLNHMAKINNEIVRAIRAETGLTQRQIAKKYNLDYRHINDIVKRRTWKCA